MTECICKSIELDKVLILKYKTIFNNKLQIRKARRVSDFSSQSGKYTRQTSPFYQIVNIFSAQLFKKFRTFALGIG
jgi:hypothetical protein